MKYVRVATKKDIKFIMSPKYVNRITERDLK